MTTANYFGTLYWRETLEASPELKTLQNQFGLSYEAAVVVLCFAVGHLADGNIVLTANDDEVTDTTVEMYDDFEEYVRKGLKFNDKKVEFFNKQVRTHDSNWGQLSFYVLLDCTFQVMQDKTLMELYPGLEL